MIDKEDGKSQTTHTLRLMTKKQSDTWSLSQNKINSLTGQCNFKCINFGAVAVNESEANLQFKAAAKKNHCIMLKAKAQCEDNRLDRMLKTEGADFSVYRPHIDDATEMYKYIGGESHREFPVIHGKNLSRQGIAEEIYSALKFDDDRLIKNSCYAIRKDSEGRNNQRHLGIHKVSDIFHSIFAFFVTTGEAGRTPRLSSASCRLPRPPTNQSLLYVGLPPLLPS